MAGMSTSPAAPGSSRAGLARLALLAYLPVAVVLTMTPARGGEITPNLAPLAGIVATFRDGGIGFGVVQLVGNLLLLLPLGALLPVALPGARLRDAVLVALAVSLTIELVQWRVAAGRMADVDDVWLNTVGAALGWLTSRAFHH
jgi:glycopeptide antibiotics resistance protein